MELTKELKTERSLPEHRWDIPKVSADTTKNRA